MASNERDTFIAAMDREAQGTIKLLRALPKDKYDFRPDADGRSIGELAWHLAEIEGYMSFIVESGKFEPGARPPGMERPRTIEALAPGYEQMHNASMDRIRKLKPEDMDRETQFFGGRMLPIRNILWDATLHHSIHHRGQLYLMCRIAGGTPSGLYGPTREETAAMKAKG